MNNNSINRSNSINNNSILFDKFSEKNNYNKEYYNNSNNYIRNSSINNSTNFINNNSNLINNSNSNLLILNNNSNNNININLSYTSEIKQDKLESRDNSKIIFNNNYNNIINNNFNNPNKNESILENVEESYIKTNTENIYHNYNYNNNSSYYSSPEKEKDNTIIFSNTNKRVSLFNEVTNFIEKNKNLAKDYKRKKIIENQDILDKRNLKRKLNILIKNECKQFCRNFRKKNNIYNNNIEKYLVGDDLKNHRKKYYKNFRNKDINNNPAKYYFNIKCLDKKYSNPEELILNNITPLELKIIQSDVNYYINDKNLLKENPIFQIKDLKDVLKEEEEDEIKKEKKENIKLNLNINIDKDSNNNNKITINDKKRNKKNNNSNKDINRINLKIFRKNLLKKTCNYYIILYLLSYIYFIIFII